MWVDRSTRLFFLFRLRVRRILHKGRNNKKSDRQYLVRLTHIIIITINGGNDDDARRTKKFEEEDMKEEEEERGERDKSCRIRSVLE